MTDRHREQMSNTLIGDDCIMGTGSCSILGTHWGTFLIWVTLVKSKILHNCNITKNKT